VAQVERVVHNALANGRGFDAGYLRLRRVLLPSSSTAANKSEKPIHLWLRLARDPPSPRLRRGRHPCHPSFRGSRAGCDALDSAGDPAPGYRIEAIDLNRPGRFGLPRCSLAKAGEPPLSIFQADATRHHELNRGDAILPLLPRAARC